MSYFFALRPGVWKSDFIHTESASTSVNQTLPNFSASSRSFWIAYRSVLVLHPAIFAAVARVMYLTCLFMFLHPIDKLRRRFHALEVVPLSRLVARDVLVNPLYAVFVVALDNLNVAVDVVFPSAVILAVIAQEQLHRYCVEGNLAEFGSGYALAGLWVGVDKLDFGLALAVHCVLRFLISSYDIIIRSIVNNVKGFIPQLQGVSQ